MVSFFGKFPNSDGRSSNINEVIRTVLNSLIFFTKRFSTHQKHQKAPKSTKKHQKASKNKKAQKHNQTKAQNANKRTKI